MSTWQITKSVNKRKQHEKAHKNKNNPYHTSRQLQKEKKKYHILKRKSQLIIPNHEEKEVLKRIILVKCVSGLKQLSKKGQGIWTYWIHLPIVHGEEAVIRPSPFSGWSSFLANGVCPEELSKQEVCLKHAKLWRLRRKLNLFFHLGND